MTEKNNNRWEKWFQDEKHTSYVWLLEGIEDYIDQLSDDNKDSTDYFTPHDNSHCRAVEKIVKAIINKSKIKLSETEKFILFSSIWTHDIGMFESVSREYLEKYSGGYSSEMKRELHDKISAWFITEDARFYKIFKELCIPESLFQSYIHTINIICKYHRRNQDINNCPKNRFIKDQKIQARLLACLVRLGDTLHVDSSRFDRKLYSLLQIGNFDRTSRLHWLKSYVVSAVHLDIDKRTIYINVDLPETEDNKKLEWDENAKRLEFILRENILEDVLVVADVFREYDIPLYSSVKVNIDRYPGFEKERKEEIISILNDLDIVLSPNTSKVIKKSIDSILSLSKMKFKNYDCFYNQTEQLIKYCNKIYQTRPCHVGLKNIIDMMEGEFKTFPPRGPQVSTAKVKELQDIISKKAIEIEKNRKISQKEINSKSSYHLNDIENILLFGYSEMVISFLNSYQKNDFKEAVNVYIFECGGKRQLSITNNIEYNDGLHYAFGLSSNGFKNINILPDTSFVSLLNDRVKNISSNNSIFLIGVNGIDESDDSCGHTSGHLMMALIANYYKIPIKVVADKYKKGKISWNPSLKRDGLGWLVGTKEVQDEIKNRNITVINYREDKIPGNLISEIIIDN